MSKGDSPRIKKAKEKIAYDRQVRLYGKAAGDTILYFWLDGYDEGYDDGLDFTEQ